MNVRNRLVGGRPIIEHEVDVLAGQLAAANGAAQTLAEGKEFAGLGRLEVAEKLPMLAGNHQSVARPDRVDVQKGQEMLVLIDPVRRSAPCHDFTEDAAAHVMAIMDRGRAYI